MHEAIFITGGTGTLGKALLRHFYNRAVITVFSRDPVKQAQLKRQYPGVRFVLGDIRDYDALYHSMVGHDVVIHAAAQKHIPQGEANVGETIAINVTGSLNVATAAVQAGVRKVIGVSTDKVCYAGNTYGATKLLMEKLFIEFNARWENETSFHLCRYGNVIGSTGSVVQLWQRQMADGIKPTLTDPDMTRFWITEDEAVRLVIEAMHSKPGTIIIPQAPGLSMSKFAEYAGVAEYEVIGLRPGEKMHETLITEEESAFAEEDGEYFILHPQTEGPVRSRWPGYRSDDPDSLLSADLLRELLG